MELCLSCTNPSILDVEWGTIDHTATERYHGENYANTGCTGGLHNWQTYLVIWFIDLITTNKFLTAPTLQKNIRDLQKHSTTTQK